MKLIIGKKSHSVTKENGQTLVDGIPLLEFLDSMENEELREIARKGKLAL